MVPDFRRTGQALAYAFASFAILEVRERPVWAANRNYRFAQTEKVRTVRTKQGQELQLCDHAGAQR